MPIITPVDPGMKSRLQIDYGTPHSDDFQQAIATVAMGGLENRGERKNNVSIDTTAHKEVLDMTLSDYDNGQDEGGVVMLAASSNSKISKPS